MICAGIFSAFKMRHEITTIDWEELATRNNKINGDRISFRNSKAFFDVEDKAIYIDLYVSLKENQKDKSRVLHPNNNRYYLYLDESKQQYLYHETCSAYPVPPNRSSLYVTHAYILFNILSDYVAPFIKELSENDPEIKAYLFA
jgi:hypothetical protein